MSERITVGDKVKITQRGKKKIWQAEFHHDGQHCRKSLKTSNKKEALNKARKLDVELCGGTYASPLRIISSEESATEYLGYLRTEGRAPKTLKKYEGVFAIWNEFLSNINVRQLDRITLRHFDLFRAQRKAEGRRLKTLYTEGVIIKQSLGWAQSRGLLRNNPLAEAKLEKPILDPKAGPTLEQIHLILDNADKCLSHMLAVLAFTGMRSGELQRLRIEDLDLEGNWLHVVSRPNAPTKTKRSRKVPLHPHLLAILKQLPKRKGPWLFTSRSSPMYPNGDHHINIKHLNERFTKLIQKLRLRAGRDGGFTIHSLRHSFETITVNAGIPQRVIDTWLGHQSDRSMAAVYYKLSDEDSQNFMQQVPCDRSISQTNSHDEGDAE